MGNRVILKKYQQMIEDMWRTNMDGGRDLSAEQVLISVRSQCAQDGLPIELLPRKRKTQMILKKTRKEYGGLPDEIKKMDKPWTLASVERYPIPPEALPIVMRVWKQQLNWFEPFTIRQAKWVGRLYKVIPEDLVLLAHWSGLYAITERMNSLIGTEVNSAPFDAALVMGPWELLTALWTDAVKLTESIGEFPLNELVQLSQASRVDFKEERDGVNKLWLDYFRKKPKWQQLNTEQQEWIRGRLRLWVLEHPWTEDPSWVSWFEYEEGLTIEQFNSHRLSNTPKIVLEKFTSNPLFKPIELLKVVGYEVNAKEVTKEAQNERTHSQEG